MLGIGELEATIAAILALEGVFVAWLVVRSPREATTGRLVDDAVRLGFRARRS